MLGKRKMGEGEDVGGSSGGGAVSYESPLQVKETPSHLKYYSYPPQLAKFEDVVTNPKVFMDTLERLHATMGTKFMIPIIGGKDLDLHRLFVEVTSRGGIEKVIRERRWKEVTAVFNFPSTATNASFVLRKYYVALIQHYEQIYFFGAKGWSPPSADPLASPSPAPTPPQSFVEPMPPPEVQAAAMRSKVAAASPSAAGIHVVGAIDGKFEHGYLVTVVVGTEKLHGVLYHTSDHPTGQVPQFSGIIANNTSNAANTAREMTATAPTVVRRRRRRKKSEIKRRDPAHPKPNRSGYNFFFQEQHARLKVLHPGKDREISKMIGELWNNLIEPEKSVYQERGLKDKERYRSEMELYRERLRTGQIISNAVPLQQRHAEPGVVMEESDRKEEEEGDEDNKMEAEEDDMGEEDKTEATEGGSPQSQENDSTMDGCDSEEEKTTAVIDARMEISASAGNGVEPRKVTEEIHTEGNDNESNKASEDILTEGNEIESIKVTDNICAEGNGTESSKVTENICGEGNDIGSSKVTENICAGTDHIELQNRDEKVGNESELQNRDEKVGNESEVQESDFGNAAESTKEAESTKYESASKDGH